MSRSSVAKLRAALSQKSAALRDSSSSALEAEVQDVAAAMRARVKIKTGALANTIEVVQTGPSNFRIQAGGAATTKEVRKGSGITYDYARAVEFGTKDEQARPFFYNTYRAKKGGMKSRVKKAALASQG